METSSYASDNFRLLLQWFALKLPEAALGALVPLLVLFYLSVAPYTKVEESFNIQATHDILASGIPFKNAKEFLVAHYDHMTFTGAVPRTFVGSLALAGAAYPFAWLVHGVDKQILVRAILGLYNSFCILAYRNGVSRAYGRGAANWYLLLQASQFHIMFWASRPLPNFFAFGLSTLALRGLLPSPTPSLRRYQLSLTLLTSLGIIFRSELAVLLLTHTLHLLLTSSLTPLQTLPPGLLGLTLGLSLTLPLDSHLWQHPLLWPELHGFTYNILHSRASAWGVAPWHFYFSAALPKLLLNPAAYLLCIPVALRVPALRRGTLGLIAPPLAFVGLYSLVPHKEWRFVVYAVPPLTAAAARGADWVWVRRGKSGAYAVASAVLGVSVGVGFLVSGGLLAVSALNYPGAEALSRVHGMVQGMQGAQGVVRVHLDGLSCMTGVTRFLQVQEGGMVGVEGGDKGVEDGGTRWVYDKTEDEKELLRPEFWEGFDYVLAESPERVPGAWEIVHTVRGFAGLRVVRPGEGVEQGVVEDLEARYESPWPYGEGPWVGVERWLGGPEGLLGRVERIGRKFTGGWWIGIRMEDKIRILKKGREPVVLGARVDDGGTLHEIGEATE